MRIPLCLVEHASCWIVVAVCWLLVEASDKDINALDQTLPPPREVTIDGIAEHSFTLRWKPPLPHPDKHVKLQGYRLSYAPAGRAGIGEEKALMLPPVIHSKLVTHLREGVEYAVVLSAVYPNIQTASAPKLSLHTPLPVNELPVGDDSYFEHKIECNCSEEGMVACTRSVLQDVMCTCFPNYTGQWCQECAPGFVRIGKLCMSCPCSNATSTGDCEAVHSNASNHLQGPSRDSGTVVCRSCLPGHRGPLCRTCTAGYHWKEDRCQPINCRSFTLCAQDKGSPGCEDCIYVDNALPPVAHKSSDYALGDGSMPLIAVLVTIGFLLAVAGAITCYRYRLKYRSRSQTPFWSIELRENKSSHDCQYQHLDVASSRAVHTDDDHTRPETPTKPPVLTTFRPSQTDT